MLWSRFVTLIVFNCTVVVCFTVLGGTARAHRLVCLIARKEGPLAPGKGLLRVCVSRLERGTFTSLKVAWDPCPKGRRFLRPHPDTDLKERHLNAPPSIATLLCDGRGRGGGSSSSSDATHIITVAVIKWCYRVHERLIRTAC